MIAFVALLALVSAASCSIIPPRPCETCQQCDGPIFKVALDSCGPGPSPLPVINAPGRQVPVRQKPLIHLPAFIPPTKTIGSTCKCVKTIVKPQVVQQVISVPSVQPYLETSSRPIVEKITFNAVPINCPSLCQNGGFSDFCQFFGADVPVEAISPDGDFIDIEGIPEDV